MSAAASWNPHLEILPLCQGTRAAKGAEGAQRFLNPTPRGARWPHFEENTLAPLSEEAGLPLQTQVCRKCVGAQNAGACVCARGERRRELGGCGVRGGCKQKKNGRSMRVRCSRASKNERDGNETRLASAGIVAARGVGRGDHTVRPARHSSLLAAALFELMIENFLTHTQTNKQTNYKSPASSASGQ